MIKNQDKLSKLVNGDRTSTDRYILKDGREARLAPIIGHTTQPPPGYARVIIPFSAAEQARAKPGKHGHEQVVKIADLRKLP